MKVLLKNFYLAAWRTCTTQQRFPLFLSVLERARSMQTVPGKIAPDLSSSVTLQRRAPSRRLRRSTFRRTRQTVAGANSQSQSAFTGVLQCQLSYLRYLVVFMAPSKMLLTIFLTHLV